MAPPLAYSAAPRRRFRAYWLPLLALLGIVGASMFFRGTIDKYWRAYQFRQLVHACATWAAAQHTLAYHSDAAAGPVGADYGPLRKGGPTVLSPTCWRTLSKLRQSCFWVEPGEDGPTPSVVFLHEIRSPRDGRPLILRLGMKWQVETRVTLEFQLLDRQRLDAGEDSLDCLRGAGDIDVYFGDVSPSSIELYAGRCLPGEPNQFEFEYRTSGITGVITGRLILDDELSDGPIENLALFWGDGPRIRSAP